MNYYNEVRTHLSLGKDAPTSRRVHRAGHILCRPVLGGLHQAAVRWRPARKTNPEGWQAARIGCGNAFDIASPADSANPG
jgi:hypothetical protein